MDSHVATLISSLGLIPHPEGGYYQEVFRSSHIVQTKDGCIERTALTTIFYLLPRRQVSRLHRIAADEVWHYFEGDPLELHCLGETLMEYECFQLGPVDERNRPVRVIPAGTWQAACTWDLYIGRMHSGFRF